MRATRRARSVPILEGPCGCIDQPRDGPSLMKLSLIGPFSLWHEALKASTSQIGTSIRWQIVPAYDLSWPCAKSRLSTHVPHP
jgi:hypothetical protein